MLIKQVNPDYDYDGKDIDVTVNSRFDSITWFGGNEPIQANQVDFLEMNYIMDLELFQIGLCT